MSAPAYLARLEHRRCYVGLDLSATKDLTALVGVFPDDVGPGFDVLAEFFVPADALPERVRRDRAPYDQFARGGWLTLTHGNVVDHQAVRRTLHAWRDRYEVREIAFDPYNATELVRQLGEEDGFTVSPMRQGFLSLSAPSKALETAILSRALRHDGNPVLRWNVANVSLETDAAGNIKPSKERSTEKIDGVVALIMAIDRLQRLGGAPAPKQYQMIVFGGR
jgi:phage terminase large subunit-like protein